jgi:hypothetical protein
MLSHYLQTAVQGSLLLDPARDTASPAPLSAGVTPELLTGRSKALAWYDSEFAVLLAAARLAGSAGLHTYTGQLTRALLPFLDLRERWREWTAVSASPLAAAEVPPRPQHPGVAPRLGHLLAVQGISSEAGPPPLGH